MDATETEKDAPKLKRQTSVYSKKGVSSRHKSPGAIKQTEWQSSEDSEPLSRKKPRSRSLVRRSSRKAKQQIIDAQSDDCRIS